MSFLFQTRSSPPVVVEKLIKQGIHPVLASLYAARGLKSKEETETALKYLISPFLLKNIKEAAHQLANAIDSKKKLLIIADYDCDGATACAVGIRGLRKFGANIDYLVPNRFKYGYGLTPEIVSIALQKKPDWLITVDNGIASIEGVKVAKDNGLKVLITDHHLPSNTLPEADVIVNPNQPNCTFPSKCIAGVGVIFYLLLALRAEYRARGAFTTETQPRLNDLLDLVALGTVADVVPLDANNRILVAQGLLRIRTGKMQVGIAALFRAAMRDARSASSNDLGFSVGPRLNAAGRLADMSIGIECLITDEPGKAWSLAQKLDEMNGERRTIESDMHEDALANLVISSKIKAINQDNQKSESNEQKNILSYINQKGSNEKITEEIAEKTIDKTTLSMFSAEWHQGVIGIVASRLKDRFHRPCITFALDTENNNIIKGSGRSIHGFHLRDALDLISKRHPSLILKFGGHAMAAGLTIHISNFDFFENAFETVGKEWLSPELLTRVVMHDGELESAYYKPEFVDMLDEITWGQGFAAPLFCGEFNVSAQSLVKEKHLKMKLMRDGKNYDAIWFNHIESLPAKAFLAYRLNHHIFNGLSRVQMVIEHAKVVGF